jgi:hypothetical protein
MVVHFLWPRYVVILFHSLKFARALLSKDCLNCSVSLVSSLRLTYLNDIIVPCIHADGMSWISFIFRKYKIRALSRRSGIFSHHSFVKLQWSLLLNTGEDKVSAIKITQVPQRLAQQLLLHGLVSLGKFVVLRPNDRNWENGFVNPVCVTHYFGPILLTLLLYPSIIFDFIVL